jgi:hypothetical protein
MFMVAVLAIGAGLLIPLSVAPASLSVLENVVILIAALGATVLMTRTVNRKPVAAAGLGLHHATLRDLGAGALLGFLMMTGIYLLEIGLGFGVTTGRGLSTGDALWVVAGGFGWFAAGALGEELLFRGYPFQTLIQAVTFLPATLIMAGVFAAAHAQNPHMTVLSALNVALAGVLFSIAYMKTRSLWLPFGIHWAWNFCQTTLYGFPGSGLAPGSHALVITEATGPAWITGGAFGPEGGILSTLALMIATWYVLKAAYLAAPEGIITLDSVEDLLGPRNGKGTA